MRHGLVGLRRIVPQRNASRYNAHMNSLLSRQRIASLCRPAAQQVTLQVVAETGSTNADLLARLGQLSGPELLVAESQNAGRGRAGRVWHSAAGATLTFSLAWNFAQPVHALVGLPLAVGVVIAEALSAFGVDAGLKWPNDILKNGKKLGGILIETASANGPQGDTTWAVIGIGLNLAMTDGLSAQIGQPVAELALKQLDRDALMAELLSGLAEALHVFMADGFKPFVPRWNALHAYAGQQVLILDGERILHAGTAVGVDQIGRLVLDTSDGRIAVMAGDVSLRPLGA